MRPRRIATQSTTYLGHQKYFRTGSTRLARVKNREQLGMGRLE